MTETAFEDDASIDIDDLKGEIVRQPNLYYKWSKKYASAKAGSFKASEILKLVKSEEKAFLEEVRAKLDSQVRSDWDVLGFDKKPTEAAISSWIVTQQAYIDQLKIKNDTIMEAVEDVASAIEDEETYDGAKLAMGNKKVSLQDLVSLRVTEFYSEPKVPSTYRQIAEQEADVEELNTELNERMQKRTRTSRKKGE